MKWFFISVVFFIQTTSFACLVKVASLDVGSNATKILVADYDKCHHKIVNAVEAFQKIQFKDNALVNDGRFSSDFIQEASQQLINLIDTKILKGAGVEVGNIFAVATSGFRAASNNEKIVDLVFQSTGVMIEVISQEKEALIGNIGVNGVNADKKYPVIDIGGGSMQMTFENFNKEFFLFNSDLGAKVFMNQLKDRRELSNLTVGSINPIQRTDVASSQKICSEYMGDLQKEICEFSDVINFENVIGIGGVFAKSIKGQLRSGQDYFTKDDIYHLLQKRIDEQPADKELEKETKYPETQLTNILLVYNLMEVLGIERIFYGPSSLNYGVLSLYMDPTSRNILSRIDND